MSLNATSLAAAVGSSVRNVQFKSGAFNLPRKILIMGTYDPALTTVSDLVPKLVTSAEDAGDKFGFGFMIHRLVAQAFIGSQGVETWVLPRTEAPAAAAAAGVLDFTGSTGVLAGSIYLGIANIPVNVAVTAGMTPTQIATAVTAAITADKTLPVTAVPTSGSIALTSKSKGPWGNDISIKLNRGYGQALPTGVVAAITAMTGGSGIPPVADMLEALGTGDSANEAGFTDVVHGFGEDTTSLDAISTYVGSGDTMTGLYSKTVARPFRALTGDVVAGSAGLSDLIDLADLRKLDRANGVIAVPGSASHPSEIAAQAIGHMARINQDRVAQHYVGVQMIGIDTGLKGDRWTSEYDNRDTAVKNGISPTKIQNGVVTMQNVITFYRPDNVPVSSNGYRSMRNISIIQNMLENIRVNFEQEKWLGISIVADTAKVTNTLDRQKARDVDSVKDDLVALAESFEAHAWIYEAAFTISKLKEAGAVTIRDGGIGFDNILSVIFSGEGAILDTTVEFDTSLAVLLS